MYAIFLIMILKVHINQLFNFDYITLIKRLFNHYALIIYWTVLLIVLLYSFEFFERKFNTARIIKRKFFHVLALVIYLPGIKFMESDILLFISAAMIYLFILVEKIRNKFSQFYYMKKLTEYLINNIDGRDDQNFLLTHIFLLFGCFSSLLYKETNIFSLDDKFKYNSLIVLGVGDSLASVVGTKFGRTRIYPPTKKTLEGTIAAVLGCCIFSSLINWQLIDVKEFICFIIIFLYEGFTLEIDNLVLPIFTNKILSILY